MPSKYTPNSNVSSDACLSEEQLQALASNRLPKEEASRLKQHIAQCDFCQDALEGARFMNDPEELSEKVAFLQKQIRGKAQPAPQTGGWSKLYTMGIAASLLLILGYFGYVGSMSGLQETAQDGMLSQEVLKEDFPQTEEADMAMDDESNEKQLLALEEAPKKQPLKKRKTSAAERSSKQASQEKTTSNRPEPSPEEEEEETLKDVIVTAQGTATAEQEAEESRRVAEKVKEEAIAATEPAPTSPRYAEERRNQAVAKMKAEAESSTEGAFTADSSTQMVSRLKADESAEGSQKILSGESAASLPAVEMQRYRHPSFSNSQNKLMAQGRKAFNEGRLQEAEGKFRELLSQVPQSRVANYLAGINYLYMENAERAREKLMQVAKRSGEVSFESVNWPSVLALLKDGKIEEAKHLLQTYSQQEGLIKIR